MAAVTITTPKTSAPSGPPAVRPGRLRRNRWPWLLAAGWAVQACLRLWLARPRVVPAAMPDEAGYLAAARLLAGGPGADLSGSTFYKGGYPLLLVPAHWLSDDPETVYRLVMAINAVIGALIFPLGYAALRRLALSRPASFAAAFAVALLPAGTIFGRHALADAVLPVLTLAWLLALDRFARLGGGGAAIQASLAACFIYSAHSRGTVILAVHAAALLAPTLVDLRRVVAGKRLPATTRRKSTWWGVGIGVLGGVAGAGLNGWVLGALYPSGARDLGGILVERLTTVDGQARAVAGAAGQVWYLVVSTWGLAGVGLVAAAVAVVRGSPAGVRAAAAALLGAVGGIAYASSSALPDEHRIGNFVYGRYLASLAAACALVGVAVLVRGRRRVRYAAGAAGLVAVTGAWVEGYAGDRLHTHTFIAFDFLETGFLTGNPGELRLGAASAAAVALLAALVVAGRAGACAVAAGLLAINAVALAVIARPLDPAWRPAPIVPATARGGVVADPALSWRIRTALIHPVWWTRIGEFDPRSDQVPGGVCTAVLAGPAAEDGEEDAWAEAARSWPRHPAGWSVAYSGGAGDLRWVVWRGPGCLGTNAP